MGFTEREIHQQPDLWLEVYDLIVRRKDEIVDFLSRFSVVDTEFVFTGAGSSFFVAQTVSGIFQRNTGFRSRCVSTTELVTHPSHYVSSSHRTVLVSFARSGESPESMAAVRNAEIVGSNVHHLIITCNGNGTLAHIETRNPRLVIVLPPRANDRSLAMTSSVTSMILTTILISRIKDLDAIRTQVEHVAGYANHVFDIYEVMLREIAELQFDRAVFLGSGPFLGIAREAHLKIQELTDGEIVAKFDSFLGFRHGPKVVVNDKTLVVYHCSNNPYVFKYERDLIEAVSKQNPAASIAICEKPVDFLEVDNIIWATQAHEFAISEDFLTIYSLVPAQLLAFYKSVSLGYNPDNPSKRGAIHRVVQGVKIYEYKDELYELGKQV